MQKVIVLNGPAGVGKTTIGRLLAKKFPSSVCIEGDVLKNFIVNKSSSVKGRLGYKNAASLILNYLDGGYELIVFEYIFPSKVQFEYFLAELKSKVSVQLFTLWAPLEIVIDRESKRTGRDKLGERVNECYVELEKNISELGMIIETQKKSPEEIAAAILDKSGV